MKKGKFDITVTSGWSTEERKEERIGMISRDLGFYKDFWNDCIITHLKTGCKMASFQKRKQAINFITHAEQAVLPIPLDKMTVKNCRKNAAKIKEIIKAVENEQI